MNDNWRILQEYCDREGFELKLKLGSEEIEMTKKEEKIIHYAVNKYGLYGVYQYNYTSERVSYILVAARIPFEIASLLTYAYDEWMIGKQKKESK